MEPDFKKLKSKMMNDDYAMAFYAALCNVVWIDEETKKEYSCSWRYAGEIVADLRDIGETYLDFYCGGNEGRVREDVYRDMAELGWSPQSHNGDKIIPTKG